MINLNEARNHIIAKLNKELPVTLTCHHLEHTPNVGTQCMLIAKGEEILNNQRDDYL